MVEKIQIVYKQGAALSQMGKYRIINVIDCKNLLFVQVQGFLTSLRQGERTNQLD